MNFEQRWSRIEAKRDSKRKSISVTKFFPVPQGNHL